MKKKLLASVFALSMLVGTVPIFAASNSDTAASNEIQPIKLNTIQPKLSTMVNNVNSLLATYKNSKDKDTLMDIHPFKRQVKMFNAQVNQWIKHHRNKIIQNKTPKVNHTIENGTVSNITFNETKPPQAEPVNITFNQTKPPKAEPVNITFNQTKPPEPANTTINETKLRHTECNPWDVIIKPLKHLYNNKTIA